MPPFSKMHDYLKWALVLLCLLTIPGAFLAPALVDYFDTQEHVITDCTVLDTTVHFHKNGCERCYDEDDCEDYDCFTLEYNVAFKYKDINMTDFIEDDDEFDDSQDADDRIAHDHPVGSTDPCVVNPTKKGGYEVKWVIIFKIKNLTLKILSNFVRVTR